MPGVGDLQRGQLVHVRVHDRRERPQRRRRGPRAPVAAQRRCATRARATASSTPAASTRSTVRSTSSVAGLMTSDVAHARDPFRRDMPSPPRRRPRTDAGRRVAPRDATAPPTTKVSPGQFDRLDHAVGVARADDQALAQLGRWPGGGSTAHRNTRRSAWPAECPARSCTRDVENTALPAWCLLCPTTSGRCWCSVPPSATLSTCAPRQMPSTGSPRFSAPASSANSQLVAVVAGFVGLGVRRLAVARRVDVLAAGDHQAVQPVEHPVRDVRRRPAAAATAPRSRLQASRPRSRCAAGSLPARPKPRSAPARGRWSCPRRGVHRQSRSKPRTLSQSVTAELNAASSTRALFR